MIPLEITEINKHENKIINCYNSLDECLNFLNNKGKILDSNFNILEYKVNNEVTLGEITFDHKPLFKILYPEAWCIHQGDIHIFALTTEEDFDVIYQELQTMYA